MESMLVEKLISMGQPSPVILSHGEHAAQPQVLIYQDDLLTSPISWRERQSTPQKKQAQALNSSGSQPHPSSQRLLPGRHHMLPSNFTSPSTSPRE
eukprot:1145222-Pelagomonas_calceolata.AAC.9